MFKMLEINDIKTKSEARSFAIDWQDWQSKQALSYEDVVYWENYFINLGIKFNLTEEFKENLII